MKFLIFLTAAVIHLNASADLVSVFKQMETNRKGAFGLNVLQGASRRVNVNSGNSSPENFQFQAAFRNEIGNRLAQDYNFYVGNLFTTNYYELMGEYVYGSASSSHPINHSALLAKNAQAMPKAVSMAKHWVLEKYYTARYPQSALAKGFTVRGISGSEFESEYADYFFDFYLSSQTNEFQFLPVFLLAKDSPIGSSNQLDRARHLISILWDQYSRRYNSKDPILTRLYSIRNQIHNQLSVDVIPEIDQFIAQFPEVKRISGYNDLLEVRKILVTFFSFGPEKLVTLAQNLGAVEIKNAAQKMMTPKPQMTDILALSNAVAELKSIIGTSQVPFEKKSLALQVIFNASLLLNKLIIFNDSPVSAATVESILNIIYIEGFLLKDNWLYFKQEVRTKTDGLSALAILPEIIEVANDSLVQAFAPSLEQWKSIDPKMLNFIDDTLKSTAINTASVIAQRTGK